MRAESRCASEISARMPGRVRRREQLDEGVQLGERHPRRRHAVSTTGQNAGGTVRDPPNPPSRQLPRRPRTGQDVPAECPRQLPRSLGEPGT
jgi:hypothetical protein